MYVPEPVFSRAFVFIAAYSQPGAGKLLSLSYLFVSLVGSSFLAQEAPAAPCPRPGSAVFAPAQIFASMTDPCRRALPLVSTRKLILEVERTSILDTVSPDRYPCVFAR